MDEGSNEDELPTAKENEQEGKDGSFGQTILKMMNMRGTEVPQVFPVKRSHTSDALKQAVEFIASGKPVSKEFVGDLRRMLTSVEERTAIVNIIFQHHQMHRLQKIHGAIEQAEAIMLSPETMERLDADQMLRLLQMLYGESSAVHKTLHAEIQPSSETADVMDPTKLASAEAAREKVGSIPVKVRKMVREQLLRLLPAE